jgi:hypothetical protein
MKALLVAQIFKELSLIDCSLTTDRVLKHYAIESSVATGDAYIVDPRV